jgi:hypothetical protein
VPGATGIGGSADSDAVRGLPTCVIAYVHRGMRMASRYGAKAKEKVERAMHERKRGTLKTGSGKTVKSRKQAIAIGLSEARQEGGKAPAPRNKTASSRSRGGGSRSKASAGTSSRRKTGSSSGRKSSSASTRARKGRG